MQAFEWTKLIHEGVRPWENPWGAAQFGSNFFMITGFHGTHVTIGVIFLIIVARKVWRGDFDVERRGFFTSRKGNYERSEEHTSELQSLMRISYAVFCLNKQKTTCNEPNQS